MLQLLLISIFIVAYIAVGILVVRVWILWDDRRCNKNRNVMLPLRADETFIIIILFGWPMALVVALLFQIYWFLCPDRPGSLWNVLLHLATPRTRAKS